MPRQKEFDYEEKLTVARDIFWKNGYNATSMNDLENAMKINRSSMYLTYGNKHELFIKSLNQYIQNKSKQYSEAAAKGSNPLEAVKNIINSVFESAIKETNCLFTNSIYELALADKEVGEILKKETLSAVEQIETLLDKAKENGSLKTDKPTRALAHFIVSGLASMYYNQILFSDKKLTKQSAEILFQSIIK